MLLIRAWSCPADLSARIRAALLTHPQANTIILPGLGVMVLASGVASLQRHTAIVERLILLAAGQKPAVSCGDSEARGKDLLHRQAYQLSGMLVWRLEADRHLCQAWYLPVRQELELQVAL